MIISQGVEIMLNKIFLTDDISKLKKIYKELRVGDSVIINESVSDSKQKSFYILNTLNNRMSFLNRIQFLIMIPCLIFIAMYTINIHMNNLFEIYGSRVFYMIVFFIFVEIFIFIFFEIFKSKFKAVVLINRYLISLL